MELQQSEFFFNLGKEILSKGLILLVQYITINVIKYNKIQGYNPNLMSNLCVMAELEEHSTNKLLNLKENSTALNPEGLKFDTGIGFKVRPKSEAIIAMVLHKYGLIFKYEMHIYINGRSYCPDFVIIDKNGQIIICEHFGMMDNRDYQVGASKKVGEYLSADLVIGKNLIITSETSKMPLDISVVEDFVARIAQGI